MIKNRILNKINNLNHELEYYKKVYPGSKKVKILRSKISYYNKKLSSLWVQCQVVLVEPKTNDK